MHSSATVIASKNIASESVLAFSTDAYFGDFVGCWALNVGIFFSETMKEGFESFVSVDVVFLHLGMLK